jgi:copper chaperone CopZ
MKTFALIISIIFLSNSSNAQTLSANLVAGGLTCSMCSKSIYKALSRLSFVEKVMTDIKTTSYSIEFKDTIVNPDEIRKAVENAGFTILALTLNTKISNFPVEKDTHTKINGLNLHFINTENQVLNGIIALRVVDKNFISDKECLTYKSSTELSCYETGTIASCCLSHNIEGDGERIFHVITVQTNF